MPSAILPSFAKGQLDTSLHGRVDTAAYQVGLAKARNMIIHSAGGCSNRSGLLFIGPCKTHTAAGSPRLIELVPLLLRVPKLSRPRQPPIP